MGASVGEPAPALGLPLEPSRMVAILEELLEG